MENQKKYTPKLQAFSDVSISKKKQKEVVGGLLFKLVDDIRCSLERSTSRLFGGNGDGDW